MISAALLGGVGLTTLKLTDSQSLDENFSETDLAMEVLYQKIYLNLEDPLTCSKVLGGKGASITNGKAINKIFNHRGDVLIQTGGTDSRKLIRIDSMKLKNLNRARRP